MSENTIETIGTATYSPEDNKLRLYAFSRLSKDDYTRAKSLGFSWAPKQELFYAVWSPRAEDLLLEWCGEIEDEDKSLVERAEERSDRFRDYSHSRAKDADQAHKAVAAIADNIPLGQPILVGHHSEKRARRDAEKIENGMRKAVRMWETSEYWKQRAAGAIRNAKYKERPDVRARRIKKLESEQRGQERAKASAQKCVRFWEGKFVGVAKDGTKTPIEITEANRETICRCLGNSSELSFYASRGIDGQSHYSGWDVLNPDGDRYKNCPAMTVDEVKSVADKYYAAVIAHCDRWISHLGNRLAYERAMLVEDGGTVADQTGPEVGGGCKCWASAPGGWAWIQKVNKVSVTILDNWGNQNADGSPMRNFTRTIPFDKLTAVMTVAQVAEAREAGRLRDLPDKTGFALMESVPPVTKPATLVTSPEAAPFKAMKETLKAGVQVVSAPNLFPTPPVLARRMVEMGDVWCVHRLLEPSAGTGAIMEHLTGKTAKEPVAVEINHQLADALQKRWPGVDVWCADFLECNGDLGQFDRILMNPPFENGSDIKHIEHALTFLKPGGRLVAICANGPRQQETLKPLADHWEDLPEGTFEGTSVRAALLVIQK